MCMYHYVCRRPARRPAGGGRAGRPAAAVRRRRRGGAARARAAAARGGEVVLSQLLPRKVYPVDRLLDSWVTWLQNAITLTVSPDIRIQTGDCNILQGVNQVSHYLGASGETEYIRQVGYDLNKRLEDIKAARLRHL